MTDTELLTEFRGIEEAYRTYLKEVENTINLLCEKGKDFNNRIYDFNKNGGRIFNTKSMDDDVFKIQNELWALDSKWF